MRKNIILPNMITLLNMMFGVYAIVVSIEGITDRSRFTLSAIAIIIAGIFDGLDGKVARLVNGTSDFGVQLDSLADVVSFGVAPAILIYNWGLAELNQIGIMAIFLFTSCGALRLARFNVQTSVISNIFFVGIPIPAAAVTLASWILFVDKIGVQDAYFIKIITAVLIISLGLLMFSRVPYFSFKNTSFIRQRNLILILVCFIFLVGLEPKITMFIVLITYVISGFFMIKLRKKIIMKLDKDATLA